MTKTAAKNGTGKRRSAIGNVSVDAAQTVALYCRVSTEDQSDRETIQNQLDFLRRYASLHELPVAAEYLDDGVSGRVPFTERPAGQRLLDAAAAGRLTAVLVYNVKRLGRRLRVVLAAHDALDAHGVTLRSGTEPIDTSTPTGRLLFHLLGGFAEFDVDERAEVMSLGRNRVASRGQYTGGPIPLGYDVDAEKRFIRSERVVEALGITEAEMITELFTRIASGQSTAKAEAVRLTALGVPNTKRYGGKEGIVKERPANWRGNAIQAILHNPMYRGESILDTQFGEVTRPVPALVDPGTWQRAQDALLHNRRVSPKNGTQEYLLRGLVRCANCGAGFGGAGRHTRRKGQTVFTRRYGCAGQANHNPGTGAPRCPAKMLPADWLEDVVWRECRAFILNPGEALEDARRKLRERLADSTRYERERRQALDALAAKEAERERILTLYRRGTIDTEDAERHLDAIARETGLLRADVEATRAQMALLDIQESHLTQSAAMLDRLRDQLVTIEDTNDLTRKREIISLYVRQVTVETRRVGPRKLEADLTLALRLQPTRHSETLTPARSR